MTSKLKRIRLLLLDVDGVLTNGKFYISNNGDIHLPFDVKDGSGIRYLMRGGLNVGIITGKDNKAVSFRAQDLNISIVHRKVTNKVSVLSQILRSQNLLPEEALYMGDDLLDLGIMARVGISVAVADAVPEVIEAADFVTDCKGGNGAVREVCEMILKAQDKWDAIVEYYRSMQ
ncbi:MAG: HAD hydrolase family protein [Candidatus Coatesbacteria bacterium]|nr:HAD hydrolase family protein [Candidatus Coatesbacteria bacterium]